MAFGPTHTIWLLFFSLVGVPSFAASPKKISKLLSKAVAGKIELSEVAEESDEMIASEKWAASPEAWFVHGEVLFVYAPEQEEPMAVQLAALDAFEAGSRLGEVPKWVVERTVELETDTTDEVMDLFARRDWGLAAGAVPLALRAQELVFLWSEPNKRRAEKLSRIATLAFAAHGQGEQARDSYARYKELLGSSGAIAVRVAESLPEEQALAFLEEELVGEPNDQALLRAWVNRKANVNQSKEVFDRVSQLKLGSSVGASLIRADLYEMADLKRAQLAALNAVLKLDSDHLVALQKAFALHQTLAKEELALEKQEKDWKARRALRASWRAHYEQGVADGERLGSAHVLKSEDWLWMAEAYKALGKYSAARAANKQSEVR